MGIECQHGFRIALLRRAILGLAQQALGVGGIPRNRLTLHDRSAWQTVLTAWFRDQPDSGTHSAAGWALQQWQVDLPALATSSQPDENRDWFVNSLGMTMVKIRPGQFLRKSEIAIGKDQTVKLTRAYHLCDREVTIDQFRRFIDDAECPKEDKPANPPPPQRENSEMYPQPAVSWYDAVLFCNWLSRKEGLKPCYERTGKKETFQKTEYDAWRLVADGTGYRLPTEAEWEYACRAGTTTDFACGSGDDELLRKYAVFQSNRAGAVAAKLPNGRGLFDVHGNIWEWCYDWFDWYAEGEISDPAGPLNQPSGEASNRTLRGGGWPLVASGCHSAYRGRYSPNMHHDYFGFRVARSWVP